MNDSNDILKALGFSDEFITEINNSQSIENFELEYISFENEVEDEVVGSSNMAIVETYTR